MISLAGSLLFLGHRRAGLIRAVKPKVRFAALWKGCDALLPRCQQHTWAEAARAGDLNSGPCA